MSAGGATKSAERYVCIIIRIALRVGVEFILLLGEVCHVTNCDNSEHAFVNKGDSRYFVCSSWNIRILVDSFFITCPWIVLNILLECYSSTRWRTGIYSQRQGSRFVLPSFVWQVDTCQLIPSWLPQCWDQRYQLDEVSSNLRPLTPHRIWALDNNTSKHLSILKSSESLVFEVGDCMKVLHLSC